MTNIPEPQASTKTKRKARRAKLRIETAVVYPEASEPERQVAVLSPEYGEVMREQTSRDFARDSAGDSSETLRDLVCRLKDNFLADIAPIIEELRHLHSLLGDLRDDLAQAGCRSGGNRSRPRPAGSRGRPGGSGGGDSPGASRSRGASAAGRRGGRKHAAAAWHAAGSLAVSRRLNSPALGGLTRPSRMTYSERGRAMP